MIYFLAKSLVEIPVGSFIDKNKSEKDDLYTALGGTLLTALCYILYPSISEVWQLYVVQALSGAGAAIAYPGWYTIFTRHVDKNKEGFEWSLYDVLLGLGMAGTAALGAFLINAFGFNAVFYGTGVMTAIGAFLLFVIRKKIYIRNS
jgi:MFS family permease